NFDGIVYDIGFGEFDHHQKDAPLRENGAPYAAFGLIWREFGERVMTQYCPADFVQAEVKRFDEKFIRHIDKDDNTGCGDIIADLIGGFNPAWDATENETACFNRAVDFATIILKNKFTSVSAMHRANIIAKKALCEMKDGIVQMPVYAPWKMALIPSDALYVVYPSQRGGFSAQCVPNDDEQHTLKIPFPKTWTGLSEAELIKVSGIATMRFCHNSGFLVSATTLEDAIAACKKAVEFQNQQ
ncbi:MAG: MYG1 family protein, partial [Oscillospiraceae bacterium]